MSTYLVWSEDDPEPAEVEANNPYEACKDFAITKWNHSAGECSTDFSLYCEGTLFGITIEFDPYAHASEVKKPDPVEECPQHDCKRVGDGDFWSCLVCWDHHKKARAAKQLLQEFEEFERAAAEWAEEVER